MFSQTAEYAIRVVVCLASSPEAPMTTRQIARTTRIPEGYLAKVLQGLSRSGLLIARRGLHGGFALASSPESLTVHQILSSVEPMPRITRCPLGLRSHGPDLCALHRRMDDALATIEQVMRGTTVAEILRDASPIKPMAERSDSSAAASPGKTN